MKIAHIYDRNTCTAGIFAHFPDHGYAAVFRSVIDTYYLGMLEIVFQYTAYRLKKFPDPFFGVMNVNNSGYKSLFFIIQNVRILLYVKSL